MDEDREELFPEEGAEPAAPAAPTEPTTTDVKAYADAPTAAAQPAPAPSAEAQPIRTVPLEVLLRTREEGARRAQQLEADLAEARRWIEERERQERELQAQAPDIFADPVAYRDWMREQARADAQRQIEPLMQQLREINLRNSELNARVSLGPDRWNALNDWIRKQPREWHKDIAQEWDPYAAAWEDYTRASTFERLGDKSLDEFVEAEVARRLQERGAAAAPIAPEQPAPRRQEQPRAPNGQYASAPPQSAPQRRPSAPSLNSVNGASAPGASVAPGSALDGLIGD